MDEPKKQRQVRIDSDVSKSEDERRISQKSSRKTVNTIDPNYTEKEDKNESFNYLKQDAIYYFTKAKKGRDWCPPPTPNYNMKFEREMEIPKLDLKKLKDVPNVRETGIKFCIENLGHILGFNNYEYDLIQFWLLDMLTDCLWKAQDIFQFNYEQQKIILNWVTELFKIIADPILNISRKDFLRLFKELIFQIYRNITKSCKEFPSTKILKDFLEQFQNDQKKTEVEEEVSSSRTSSSCCSATDSYVSTLSILSNEPIKIFPTFNITEYINNLKRNNPLGNTFHCHTESKYEDTTTEQTEENQIEETIEKNPEDFVTDTFSDISFYKSDNITPPWYHPSYIGFDIDMQSCLCKYLAREQELSLEEEEEKDGRSLYTTCYPEYNGPFGLLKDEELSTISLSSVLSKVYRSNIHHSSFLSAIKILESVLSVRRVSTHLASYSTMMKFVSESKEVMKYLTTNQSPCQIYEKIKELKEAKEVKAKVEETKSFEEKNKISVTVTINDDINDEDENDEKQREEEIMKEWAYFKLMEQRGWDMDDPNVGWVPWVSMMENVESDQETFESFVSENSAEENNPEDESKILYFKMLRAIVDFIFEYFYENFHFTLIKLAFRSTPNIITHLINETYETPKIPKQDFKRPKPSPKKKPKREKGSKKSDEKKSKSSKKEGKESEAEKKKGKKEKKSKESDSEKGKKGKKAASTKGKEKKSKESGSVKEKKGKKVITPEEKEEMERLKRLAEEEEIENMKKAENKVYIFPLADAASETLFMSIFENWVSYAAREEKDKEGKKGKKGKKGEKNEKTSKGDGKKKKEK